MAEKPIRCESTLVPHGVYILYSLDKDSIASQFANHTSRI